ncbi:RNA polymerase II-associated protein 1-like [Mytilus edulis]|uniref:RNA polymerase II-associated protein 1-like n=1 Tax=Mytilus edulis TaxID=6550 RepID=UPI0039F10252
MFSRPKPGDSEDDLLKFQQEFLANQTKAAAAVVKRGDKRKSEDGSQSEDNRDVVKMEGLPSEVPSEQIPVKKSKFRQSQEQKSKLSKAAFDPEEEMDKHDTHMAAVLTKIIERDTRNVGVSLPKPCAEGFPKVQHLKQQNLPNQLTAKTGKKKISLFAQQFNASGAKDFGSMVEQETSKIKEGEEPDQMEITEEDTAGPCAIEGTGLSATFGKDEAIKIHQENVQKLHSMPEAEIFEEQQKLLEILDPKLVAFLRKKKTAGTDQSKDTLLTETKSSSGSKNRSNKSQVKLEQKDLPVKPKKEWAHMEKLEYDKLEWLKDLPPPSTDSKETGQHARFDFHGNLMSADSDVPVNIGLHHHGAEPERPGYTLEELFHLARSTNNQQRTLALQTLSNIISKVRSGELEALVQSPVLPALIDAGVMFLLRWALDDTVEMVVSAAVSALCNLLVCDADEASLDRVFSWNQGHCVPTHLPKSDEDEQNGKVKNEEEETPEDPDADLLKRDIILCLVTRMNFLPRLRYILTKTKPQAPVVINILSILCRLAHHSSKIAYDIFQCPGLLDVILQDFLPTSWSFDDTGQPLSNVYGIPVTMAMRLMRCLAQAGQNMASILLTDNQLQARLLRYMVEVNPMSLQLPKLEAYNLQTESYRTWKVCLMYGLSTETYIDMFPVIIEKLKIIEENVCNESVKDYQMNNFIELIGALEAVVHVAGSNKSQQAKFNRSHEGQSMEVESSEIVAMPTINWGHIADLLHPMSRSLTKILNYIKDNYQFKKLDLQCASVCLNFITSYYTRLSNQSGPNTVDYLQQIEAYCEEVLLPCWQSLGFRVIFERLGQFSNILNPPAEKRRECIQSLPSLGCSSLKEESILPVLHKGSPCGFVTALLNQIHTLGHIHKGLQDKILPLVLKDADIASYMKKVAGIKQGHLHSNCFTRFENLLQYYYLKLAVMWDKDILFDASILQCLTLKLLTRLHHGDEFIAHDLFSTVLFRPTLWSNQSETETLSSLESLKLSDITHLRSATQQEFTFTCSQLTSAARSQLPSIRATYIKAFSYFEKEAFVSRHLFHMNPLEIQKLLTSSTEEFLLPTDWMYMPLIYLYNHFSSVGTEVQNALSVGETDTISNVLKWIFLLERDQSEVMSTISITLKIARLMCTFLTGNDLFLDKTVHCYLAAFLREYTKPVNLNMMNFEENIPGLLSFYDFYITVLHQFEAVSFGDSLFGCYVLIPLQQQHGLELRRSIWTEHRGILRTLYLPITEMLIPIERYLQPEETNTEMMRLYYECLLSLTVRPRWAPVLYLVAVHHVNRFIYTQDNKHTKLKHAMLKEALRGEYKDLCHHLLYYKQPDVTSDFGMEFYQTLPDIRQQLLDTVQSN